MITMCRVCKLWRPMPFSFPFLYAKQLLNVRSFSAPAPVKPSSTCARTIWKKTGELQHTISRVITKTGKGLHSGDEAVVRVLPAMAGEGRFFIVNRHEVRVPASVKNVTDTTLSVRIGRGESSVATVEHLLSALEGMGIDNCRIEVEGGNEIPLLDGSSKEWVAAIEEAGTCIARDNSGNGMEKMALVLCEPIHVLKDESFVTAFPAPSTRITYGIDFPQAAAIGCQWFSWCPVDSKAYKQNVAPSRTFCIYEQIQQLQADGFIKGGSMDNALVCSTEKGWLNPPLRFPEEPCRHKLLDLIGDLSLCAQNGHQGLPIAHIIAYKKIQETVQTTATRRYSWEMVGRRELGHFGKGRIKDNGIARRASKGESKINSNEGADLKGLSVTQQIMSAHRKT